MVCNNTLTKYFSFLFVFLFMISFTSAFEFDNVGSYDKVTKTITIENALGLGQVIGGAQLNTPQNYHVAVGYQKVAEFDLWAYEDYNDVLKNLNFYDKNYEDWDKNKFTRGYDIKYKTTKLVDEPIYSQSCYKDYSNSSEGYDICENIITGYKQVEVEDWVKVTPANLKKNERLTIGIFTNVEQGDKVEWILSLYGVEVVEWATWTEDLNVDLISYYKLDQTSGVVVDSLGVYNGTNGGSTRGVTGKINKSFSFDGSNDYVSITNNPLKDDTTGSVSYWIKLDTLSAVTSILTVGDTVSSGNYYGINVMTDGDIRVASAGDRIATYSWNTNLGTGTWYHLVLTSDGTNTKLYFNGNLQTISVDSGTDGSFFGENDGDTFSIGKLDRDTDTWFFAGDIDEMGMWERTLTPTEITQLYNGGTGITYTDTFESITTTLNEPENNTIQNDATVDFNWTITPVNLNITNWTLNVWHTNGTLAHQHINTTINTNETTTVIHNDTLLLDESYIWNVESCANDSSCDLSANWTFTLDTAPPEVNITYPPEGFMVNTPQENITLNYTVVHPVGDLSNCFYNTSSNSTPINISCVTNTTNLLYPISNPDNLTIYVFGNDTAANLGSDNVTIYKDVVGPDINATAPNGTLGYNYIGGNETLNVTFSDTNLDTCWYNYNGTNITIEGCLTGIENSTQFILEQGNLNMTIYANDSLGNLNSSFIEWDYIILEYSTTYDSEITEGETNQISTKIIITEGESITSSVLSYGVINYTTSVVYDGENYTIISNNEAPIVDSDTNYTFNFIISIEGVNYNTTTNNQTVLNLDFGICGGVSNDTLLNMSLFDEEKLTSLIGDIEFNADIISKSSEDIIESINGTFNNTNSGAICFSPISSYSMYYIDTEIRYFSDGYTTEFYHIQKGDLEDYPTNLSLFDLNQNDSTEFSVTYKNDAFIFTEGAVIQLQRKYIGENIYEVVEAPVTGDGGRAVLHIDLNTNKYRASVVKDGELLDFFDNIAFSCSNELAGDCTHSLDGTVNPNNDVPIEDITDFSYSVSIDEGNQTVTVLFAVPSGTPSTINVVLDQIDMFGNLTSCNTTIITSAGSITCDYTDTIEKSILELSISKNDVQLAVLSYVNDPDLDMDGMNFFIVFLFMISLVGMAIASPEWMILISVMILIISGTLLLLNGMSLVMGLGAIAWVVIAAAIIIFKMAKQEDR